MYYESNSSHTAFAKLEDVLDGYGLTATHVACVSGTPSEADYARLIRAPLRLGWPVALSIGGELTTHAVVATGFNDAGETRIFNGYASQGWDTLPNVYVDGVGTYTKIYGFVITRPPCAEGKLWAAVTGTVSGGDGKTAVTLTSGGETATATPDADGAYALALQVSPGETVTLACGGRSLSLAFTAPDELPRQIDFDLAAPPPEAGTLSIAPQLSSVDLEQDPAFPFRCYVADGQGGQTEVEADWRLALSNGKSVTLRDGILSCPNDFTSATLTVTASHGGAEAKTTLTLYPRMHFRVKRWAPAFSHSGRLPSAEGKPAAGDPAIWPGTRITATDILLTATTGGTDSDWTDLSEAEFQIGTNLGYPVSGREIAAPDNAGATAQLAITLQARRQGDASFDADPGVIAYVALASSASQLGFQYGDRYGRVPDSWLEAYFIDLADAGLHPANRRRRGLRRGRIPQLGGVRRGDRPAGCGEPLPRHPPYRRKWQTHHRVGTQPPQPRLHPPRQSHARRHLAKPSRRGRTLLPRPRHRPRRLTWRPTAPSPPRFGKPNHGLCRLPMHYGRLTRTTRFIPYLRPHRAFLRERKT